MPVIVVGVPKPLHTPLASVPVARVKHRGEEARAGVRTVVGTRADREATGVAEAGRSARGGCRSVDAKRAPGRSGAVGDQAVGRAGGAGAGVAGRKHGGRGRRLGGGRAEGVDDGAAGLGFAEAASCERAERVALDARWASLELAVRVKLPPADGLKYSALVERL